MAVPRQASLVTGWGQVTSEGTGGPGRVVGDRVATLASRRHLVASVTGWAQRGVGRLAAVQLPTERSAGHPSVWARHGGRALCAVPQR